ncbi:MAG TPA: hypothetical protein VFI05_05345 [Nitrospiraceae bacterium]|nr:hypothetical protein [Nitrospiraceae bacterium]
MSSGDVMKSKTRTNHVFHTWEWVVGSAAVLFLLSAGGLTLLAQYTREQANVVAELLALYLASWSYVLGIIGLLLLPVLELIDWLRMRVKRAVIRRYSSAEPRRWAEKPKLESVQSTQQNVGPLLANPSSKMGDEEHENIGLNRVA